MIVCVCVCVSLQEREKQQIAGDVAACLHYGTRMNTEETEKNLS